MGTKKIIIIGAGIAGLSAGCYAQMNGYDSEIYEMHTKSGGLCTSWERKGYTFDGCISWLTGSAPDDMMYPLWCELGAVQGKKFINHQVYYNYIDKNGRTFTFYTDVDKLEEHLKEISKDDIPVIEEMCNLIRRFKKFKPPVDIATETMGALDYIKMMPGMIKDTGLYRVFMKYGKISMGEYASKFKNPYLKEMLTSSWNPDIPMSLFLTTMAWYSNNTAGYPIGGSLEFARGIEKRYLSLGGKISYKSRVEKILVENNRAAGIRLDDGSEHYSDAVISAGDGYTAIYKMLEGKFTSQKIDDWYKNMDTFPPYIQISLGVNRDFSKEASAFFYKMDKPIVIAGKEEQYMIIHNYSYDKSLAPEGRTALTVRFFTDYSYWMDLYKDKQKYNEEKKSLADAVIAELNKYFDGISSQVEVVDVATPATYVRYTGNFRGATMSWLPSTGNFMKQIEKTLPGLLDFYMAGQWLIPSGGVPNALKTGRDVIQIICKKDKRKFATTSL